ncbi:unnamed protein product [Cylindrotheca closterium]|uniref:Uncharacterized protein n=1 Tax=Cylindrotheca closterium TaxID=2856 RepID=A0AAD2JIV8_9STRA|nr:unnamed protein product [Cylindrotheca closterium]
MDSGCTNTTICKGKLMHGLRQAEKELDMHTNVASRVLDEEWFLGRFPSPVYFDEDRIANVLAMREMIAAGYCITMDTDFDNAFVVHCDGDRQMRFVNRKGVYVLEQLGVDVKPGAKETSAMYRRQLSSVNKQPHFKWICWTRDDLQDGNCSKEQGRIHSKTSQGCDGSKKCNVHTQCSKHQKSEEYVIRSGLIKNFPITEEAINHAEAIFGPDTSTLKGKSTRPTPKKTHDDFISPPEELYQHNRTITCSCIPMQNLNTGPVFEALDKIFRRYNKAGFHVKTIKCDQAFIPLTDDMLDDMGVTIDPTAAGDYEPTAEQNNRTLKERVRVALARLPYKVVPKVITECLGRRAAELLNVFPQKDSISSHFSPQQLIDNVNINYKSDMVAELGQYVHAIGTDSINSMEPRSIKTIYIEPTKGQLLPVTDQVIQRVEAWAAAKGDTFMKFFDKKRDLETFQDGNQIAGVDDTEQGYLEEAFDQDYEPEDEDELDFNLHGQFDDIDDSKRNELLVDADNDVDDMPELTVRFQGDDDYESDDDNLGDEEEEVIVANLDHH